MKTEPPFIVILPSIVVVPAEAVNVPELVRAPAMETVVVVAEPPLNVPLLVRLPATVSEELYVVVTCDDEAVLPVARAVISVCDKARL